MENTSANSTRLIKNTLFLYMRTLLIMLISLYTTRVLLATLGIIDYGIYNVVGGWVVLMSTVSASMSGACSRFVSFAIGENDSKQCNETFSTIRITVWILAFLLFLLGESLGMWFLEKKMDIPIERMPAARICLQCILASSVINTLIIPYGALIIGHEKINAYAYISIVETILKLIIALVLPYVSYDSLIIYAILILCVSVVTAGLNILYCRILFFETKAPIVWKKTLFKEISSFAGWTFNGQLACMGYTQGINILLNLFFGPIVNAARGVAVQVQGAAKILVNNFQVALRPQMIKVWAQGDVPFMHRLVIISSKFSFFLTSLTVFPLCWCIAPILQIWLGDIPDHTINFVRIILYTMLVEAFCHGMIVSIHATGNIKRFQIWEGSSLLSVVPIAYLMLRIFHVSPETVMLVYFFVQVFTQFVRMYIVLPQINMSWEYYIKSVVPRTLAVLLFTVIPSCFINLSKDISLLRLVGVILVSFTYVALAIFIVGFNKAERMWLRNCISKMF